MGELEDGGGLSRGDVKDAGSLGLQGNVDESGGNIVDKDKVTGLEAISVNGEGGAGQSGLKKAGNGGGVRATGILAGAIHVKKPEGDGGQRGGGAKIFSGKLSFGVGAGGGGRKAFDFWHGGVIAVDGTGAGQNEALGAGKHGGLEDLTRAGDIYEMALSGVLHGGRHTDHGSEVKDVRHADEGLSEGLRIEN